MGADPSLNMDGLLVLSTYNGRPSLFMELKSGQPLLTWRAWGYTEPFDVWLQLALTWDEANEFVEQGSQFMDDYLQTKIGRVVTMVLHGPNAPGLASIDVPIPEDDRGVMWALHLLVTQLLVVGESGAVDTPLT